MSVEEERIVRIPKAIWNKIHEIVWLPNQEWLDNSGYYQLKLRELIRTSPKVKKDA